ncbi:UrcA family protein [Qipengyuania sp. ASV99]|uniref:UrcA family protein n=1 Tax=Qipengyuania sp. ASV99 TaxID=3399681 RepID=UPI003A4C5180
MRLVLSAATLALIAAAPVAAAPSAGEASVTVRVDIADIDLTSAEGRAALEARLDAKLRAACTIETRLRYGLGREIVDQDCLASARTAALAEAERMAAADLRAGRSVAAN